MTSQLQTIKPTQELTVDMNCHSGMNIAVFLILLPGQSIKCNSSTHEVNSKDYFEFLIHRMQTSKILKRILLLYFNKP